MPDLSGKFASLGAFSDRFDQVERIFSDPGFELFRAADRHHSGPVSLQFFSAPHLSSDENLTRQWEAVRALPASLWFRPQDFLREGESAVLLSWSPPGRILREVPGTLSDDIYLRWLGEACKDLYSLHAQGLLHLAQNEFSWILFQAEEEGGEESLGLGSLPLYSSALLGGRARAPALLAVPPELVTGKAVDGRADLYSLACLLVSQRAAHGFEPLATMIQRLEAHRNGRFLEFIPKADSPLNDLLRQMLQPEAQQRPRDVVEVLRRIYPQQEFSELPALPAWGEERVRRRQANLLLSTLYSLIREGEAGYALEWIESLDPAFQSAYQAYLHYLRALGQRRRKNFEAAKEFREQAIVSLPERQDKKLQVLLLLEEARALDPWEQTENLQSLLNQALRLAMEFPDSDLQAKVLVERAKLQKNLRKDEASLAELLEAERRTGGFQECLVRGKVLRDLADLLSQYGWAHAAVPLAEESLRQVEADPVERARRHVELGLILAKSGDFSKAQEEFREGKYLFSTLKDLKDLIWATAHEVRAALAHKEFKAARRELKALRGRARALPECQEILDMVEVVLWVESGEHVEPKWEAVLERVERRIVEAPPDKVFRELVWSPADSWELLARMRRKLGRSEESFPVKAAECRERMWRHFESLGIPEKYPLPPQEELPPLSETPLPVPQEVPYAGEQLQEIAARNRNLQEENQQLRQRLTELEQKMRAATRAAPSPTPPPVAKPKPPQVEKKIPSERKVEGAEVGEKNTIEEALRRHRGNRNETAVELGIHRRTLFEKMQKYGLDQISFDPSREEILQAIESCEGKKNQAAEKLGLSRSSFYRRLKELGIG